MPRFIDDLRASGKLGMPWWVKPGLEATWERYTRRVMDLVMQPELPVILADNVATYYYEASDQEFWGKDDFPNLAPPFQVFWIEHKLPKVIHSKEKGDTDVTPMTLNGRTGLLFVSAKVEDCEFKGDPPPDAKWIYWCDHFVDYGDATQGYQGAHGAVFYAIDAEGRAIGVPWMQSFARDDASDMMKNVIAWFNPGLLTISFMHCHNVKLQDHQVDKPLAKKWSAKHNGMRPTGYKTLIIEPLKQMLRAQGGHGAGNSLAKAMHICRGHFKDYRQGAGFFGKYHRLVWHPMRVRGERGDAPPREVKVKI